MRIKFVMTLGRCVARSEGGRRGDRTELGGCLVRWVVLRARLSILRCLLRCLRMRCLILQTRQCFIYIFFINDLWFKMKQESLIILVFMVHLIYTQNIINNYNNLQNICPPIQIIIDRPKWDCTFFKHFFPHPIWLNQIGHLWCELWCVDCGQCVNYGSCSGLHQTPCHAQHQNCVHIYKTNRFDSHAVYKQNKNGTHSFIHRRDSASMAEWVRRSMGCRDRNRYY